MSAAVRPTTAVLQALKVTQTNFLVWVCKFPRDSLQAATDSWVCVRRAARMAAQASGHETWTHIQAQGFFAYWGHAARLPNPQVRPISKALNVRGSSWQLLNVTQTRRARGFWPNCSRFLGLAWQGHRKTWQPITWEGAAQDRTLWKQFTQEYLRGKAITPEFYPILADVDLRGRALSKVGDDFHLLPLRHPPVDPPYATAFIEHPEMTPEDVEYAIRVSTDGSCMRGQGGAAAVLLPPYGDIEADAVVIQQAIPGRCTNIRAELVAACKGLQAIKRLKEYVPLGTFLFMSDSQHVLQLLQGAIRSVVHASDTSSLLLLWEEVSSYTSVKHVRAHQGEPLNELADECAKQAVLLPHTRMIIRRRDYGISYFEDSSITCPVWLW